MKPKIARLDNVEDLEEVKRVGAKNFIEIEGVLNGQLTFGDNFKNSLISVNFNVANTEIAAPHGLGATPSGYLIVGRNANMVVYDGLTSSNVNTIYLRASAVGIAQVMVF